ncbi:MAG TPA: ABC transporter substrate binding protein [Candidatus Polarisedimenticolia bacterium]|nr:ABC transporter substrate binding protein [Candidatus Polarisedimenticolia bacterium]
MFDAPFRPALAAAAALAGLLAVPAPLRAVDTGSIDGTVEDARGRPIPGAAVTLTAKRGGHALGRTDENGFFRIPAQTTAQQFILKVDADGFRPVAYDGLQLMAGRTRRFDVRLKRPGERDVVVLLSRDPYPFDDLLRGLLQGLDAPARTFDLDTVPDPEEVLRRVEAERPNLILASGLMAARLVRREVRDIPAVLSLLGDPRLHDLDAANLSYVTTNAPPADLIGRVRQFLPEARRLGLLFDARASTLVARDLRRAARHHGFDVVTRPCYEPEKIEQALADLAGKVDVLVVPFDPLSLSPSALDDVTHWSLSQRVALVGPGPEWVRRGALFSYGPTPETIGRDLSLLAGRMLYEGFQPEGDARLIGPGGSVLTVNTTTALALGVEIPGSVSVDATY